MSQQSLQWMHAATQAGEHGAGQVTCAMCGAELPVSLMVPDGGNACADVRWYCRDTVACTTRWTAAQAHQAAVNEAAGRGTPDDEQAEHEQPDDPDDPQDEHEQPDDPQDRHEQPDHKQNGHEQPDDPQDEHEQPDHKQNGHEQPDDPQDEHEQPDEKQNERQVTGAPDAG